MAKTKQERLDERAEKAYYKNIKAVQIKPSDIVFNILNYLFSDCLHCHAFPILLPVHQYDFIK